MKISSKLINLNGKLHDFTTPVVMGIVNSTPDSFFEGSRTQTEESITQRVRQILAEGALLIDVGAYSSRPNAQDVSEEEEWTRLRFALEVIRKTAPEALISVDTFRASVAERAVGDFGVSMINDISAGEMDAKMFDTVAKLKVPYVMMHLKGTPQTMQQHCHYEYLIQEVILYFAHKIEILRGKGVCDLIIDPGFGFSKNLDQNYELLHHLSDFSIFELPILVGLSRKSMIYNVLNGTPDSSLNGTTVLNTLALLGGANILRVHDVKEAVETIQLLTKAKKLC
jgi:dihydropteroate synthase